MSALAIISFALTLFVLAYIFYGRKLESLWQIDPKRATPAYTKYDSVDYIPARNWLVLFGHHFASIAGAGPIIGPVIAVLLWGWLPALLWVILGTIFIGGVQDFGSLIISVREGGSSIADIAKQSISQRGKIILSLFVWIALILIIAVFAWFCADTFIKQPRIVLPSLGLIPVAMLVGYFYYYLKVNSVLITVFGLVCLTGLILLGNIYPVNASLKVWLLVLVIYCYFASVLPVNILLQPRDYLSSYLLSFGVGIGYLGLLLLRPKINMPYYCHWGSSEGYLWPALFITVACGAVSGFHALISSGTTSKQIANERYARRIGYGGMITEGLVAILAVISIAVLFSASGNLNILLKRSGPIDLFGQGYGLITAPFFGKHGGLIAITILNAFILTTLDTATRISRYLTSELFKIKNRYLSTLIITLLGLALAWSGKWNRLWPAFGASNQLIAALVLLVLSCWLLAKHKPIVFTLSPAVFMLVTAVAALISQAVKYALQRDILLLAVSIILVMLAVVMAYEACFKIITIRRKYA